MFTADVVSSHVELMSLELRRQVGQNFTSYHIYLNAAVNVSLSDKVPGMMSPPRVINSNKGNNHTNKQKKSFFLSFILIFHYKFIFKCPLILAKMIAKSSVIIYNKYDFHPSL